MVVGFFFPFTLDFPGEWDFEHSIDPEFLQEIIEARQNILFFLFFNKTLVTSKLLHAIAAQTVMNYAAQIYVMLAADGMK